MRTEAYPVEWTGVAPPVTAAPRVHCVVLAYVLPGITRMAPATPPPSSSPVPVTLAIFIATPCPVLGVDILSDVATGNAPSADATVQT